MSGSSPILGLFLPGGGSQNKYGPADPVDIDKINDSLLALERGLGIPRVPTTQLPTNPYTWQVCYDTTRDYLITWNGVAWIGALPDRLSAGTMAQTYWTQAQLTAGALDGRYFTQANLLNDGSLDTRYVLKSAYGQKTVGGSTTVSATTADSDSGHNGFSGTKTVTVSGLTNMTAVTAQPARASSFEIHWGVPVFSGNTFQIYYWSSTSITNTTFYWQATGS